MITAGVRGVSRLSTKEQNMAYRMATVYLHATERSPMTGGRFFCTIHTADSPGNVPAVRSGSIR